MAMAYKYREEIVGKRFLSVSTRGKLKLNKISDWEWRSGIVRATSHKDPKHPELSVLVEFDDTDWKSREWIRLYQDEVFHLFVVENTLVWTLRKETALTGVPTKSNLYWPSLTFIPLVDQVGLSDNRLQPVEYLVDKELWFVDYADVLQYQEQDVDCPPANRDFAEVQKAIRQWTEYQDGQKILVTTPSVLVGYRVEVYRVEGTTQWYTAVIVSYNDNTRELTLTDDTVLEEHNEDPCLVQMRLIGEGVVDSILKGENIGITPRRRACTNQQAPPVHYSTRNRTHLQSTSLSNPYFNSTRISALPLASRRFRSRPAATVTKEDCASASASNSVPEKAASTATQSQPQQYNNRLCDRRKKTSDSSDVNNNHRYKKKNCKQKRTTVKDLEDTDSAEEEDTKIQAAKPSNRSASATSPAKNESLSQSDTDGSVDSKAPPEEAEAAPKVQSSIKSPKEFNKRESKSPKSAAAGHQDATASTSVTDSNNSENTDTRHIGNSSSGTEYYIDCVAGPSGVKLPISSTVSAVSVVVAPRSKTVVSSVAVSGSNSVSSIPRSPTNCYFDVAGPSTSGTAKSTIPIVRTEKSKVIKKEQIEPVSSTSEASSSCQNHTAESREKTGEQKDTLASFPAKKSPKIFEVRGNCQEEIRTPVKADKKSNLPNTTDIKRINSNTNGVIWSNSYNGLASKRELEIGIQNLKREPASDSLLAINEKSKLYAAESRRLHDTQRTTARESKSLDVSLANNREERRGIIVNAGYQKYNGRDLYSTSSSIFDDLRANAVARAENHVYSAAKIANSVPNAYGMSQVDKKERSVHEKTTNILHHRHHTTSEHSATSSSKYRHSPPDHRVSCSPRIPTEYLGIKSEDRKNVANLRMERNESVKVYRDPHLLTSSQAVRFVEGYNPNLMHPAGISHSAAAAAAAAGYPRVANLPQHSRAPMPPTTLGPYNIPSHLLPPPHMTNAGAPNAPPPPGPPQAGGHMDQHAAAMHSQAYRQLLSQHSLLPPQYQGSAAPHVGLDLIWQQKYNPNPWVMYEELRIERERALAQDRERDRERTRMERDRRDDIERMEREKVDKERHERERIQKEQQCQDRERLDREERERAQREAVQQHFEESLRLALQKQQQQLQQKSMGWSPMSNLPLGKPQSGLGRSSPTVSLPQGAHGQSVHSSEHERDKMREKDKERVMEARLRHEHERWLAAVQRSEQHPSAHSSAHQQYAIDGRPVNTHPKELYPMPRVSPHAPSSGGHMPKSGISPNSASSNSGSGNNTSQHKAEASFSLYGYQPFQHTFITQAQLKAREEAKAQNSMQPIIVTGKQSNSGHTIKQEKELVYDRPPTPGNGRTGTPIGQASSGKPLKVMHHPSQERSSPMYQPLVGSGGAFKPYEYSNNCVAPPAHQNSASPTIASKIGTSHFHHSLQDQPQNLVKVDHKASHDASAMHAQSHQRYDSRDMRQTVSTPPCSAPTSYTPPYSISKSVSPASSSNYSYNLIQQGLVPNPLYIAATHSNAGTSSTPTSSQAPSKPHSNSPPISQQYNRAVPGSGITSGTPVCRASSMTYSSMQGRNSHSYSPVGQSIIVNPGRPGVQEAHSGNRIQHNVSRRSPSPAQIYGPPYVSAIQSDSSNSSHHSRGPCSPRMNSGPNPSQVPMMHRMPMQPTGVNSMALSPPLSDTPDSQAVPLNLHGNGAKRKSKDVLCKKRQKTMDDHLLPPQLHPQILSATSSPTGHVSTPPHLMNSATVSPHQQHVGSSHHNSTEISHMVPRPDTSNASYTGMPDIVSSASNISSVDASSHSMGNIHENVTGVKHFKNQSRLDSDSPNASRSSNSSSTPAVHSTQNNGSADVGEESRHAISPASSAGSTVTTSSGSCVNHPKLKKAWLQRHSENEDKKVPDTVPVDSPVKMQIDATEDTKSNPPSVSGASLPDTLDGKSNASDGGSTPIAEINGQDMKTPKIEIQNEDDSTSSASEIEDVKHAKRKLRIGRKPGSASNSKKQKLSSANESPVEETNQSKKDIGKKSEKEATNGKRRGRKSKGRHIIPDDALKKKTLKPPEKPSIAQLKKTGEAFLQDGSCCEVAPRLPKCRECRMTPHQRSKKMPNIFCRFYAYRKLRYGKNGTILGAGFSEPSDATEDDLKLWLPPIDNPPSDIEVETSKFLLTHVGDQFCDLVEMEREAQAIHMSENTTITWKRVVQGVREMCDVCETTLFNIHWVCHKCGFVVCIDCYKARKSGVSKGEESLSKDRDQYQWLLCTNKQAHEQEKLMLTQIIANTALWDVGKTLHAIRRKWNIPTYCSCVSKREGDDSKHSANGICKLMNAVTKCFSSDKEASQLNGVAENSRSNKKGSKNSSVNGVVKQEDGISGYSSESGGSPLSWLADVALNSSAKIKDETKVKSEDDEKSLDGQQEQGDGGAESDDEKGENFSTLRELLIRPMGKMGAKNSGNDSGSQKTLTSTLDEVISCVIEQRVRKSDKKCKEKQLLHFTRRHPLLHSGRELLPIRSCMLTESSLLYPEIPHIWLGSGKILLLTDPFHIGNMQMFQEQWKRGQPVIVSNVGQKMNSSIWNPSSFIQEFGEVKNDFLNSLCGTLLQNQPMKKFWEGFENKSKRMKDDDGKAMVLKLKDWPPSEEFSELLPTRYQDLMKVLPLPQYTHRDGVFNMASRLPDCFVKPDLGPRMYSAYGISSHTNASTNLHLDVSDSVHILAYIGNPTDENENPDSDIEMSLVTSGCDLTTKERSLEDGNDIGAIWHVYNARDADKIRDLLNKVAEEGGTKCDLHHDPIHNQEWYLDAELRERLYKEYAVECYVVAQCFGDAIFIPAGSPHQVCNLKSCIKVSTDFVSPESVGHSFCLTQEIRNLSDGPLNHEDKLQIKNVIYHAVKDALTLLQSNIPEDSKS